MKIFGLYTNVTLTKKPEWLDAFLEKYQSRGLHVTLIQPRTIEENDTGVLKQKISQFISEHSGSISLVFDELIYNKEEAGAILVCAKNADTLMKLQKDLRLALSEYKNYVEPVGENYEKNFWPHITIGDKVPQQQYEEALDLLKDDSCHEEVIDGAISRLTKSPLKSDCRCEGTISEVVLAIVSDMTTEEANNSNNKTIYQL